jgi:hypothetical protein
MSKSINTNNFLTLPALGSQARTNRYSLKKDHAENEAKSTGGILFQNKPQKQMNEFLKGSERISNAGGNALNESD